MQPKYDLDKIKFATDGPTFEKAVDLYEKGKVTKFDRGLGILETLCRVRPDLSVHTKAVEVAFTEFVSGRAPEKRGNGLKLVREVVLAHPIDLFFVSGDAGVHLKDAASYSGLLSVQATLKILQEANTCQFKFRYINPVR